MSTKAGDPVSGTLAATGTIGPYQPFANVPFNVFITGTFVATVELQRSDATGVFTTVTPAELSGVAAFTYPTTFSISEPDPSVLYQLHVTEWTSGTINGQMG